MRTSTRALEETGAGTVVALALMTAMIGISLMLLNLSNRFVDQARLNAQVENAAVAAADSLRGLTTGYPCEIARELAPITSCMVIGNDVLVEASRFGLSAKARAGEPSGWYP